MTSSLRIASFLLIVSAGATSAEARPYKIDFHPAVCVKKTGLANNPGTIVYDDRQIETLGGKVDMVCPIPMITMPADTSNAMVSFEARFKGQSSGDLSCALLYRYGYSDDDTNTSAGSDWDYVGPAPFGPPGSTPTSTWTPLTPPFGIGILRASPRGLSLPLPQLGDPPLQMALDCILQPGAKFMAFEFMTY